MDEWKAELGSDVNNTDWYHIEVASNQGTCKQIKGEGEKGNGKKKEAENLKKMGEKVKRRKGEKAKTLIGGVYEGELTFY